MLPSVHRLRRTEDFREIRRIGKKYVCSVLIIHVSLDYFGTEPSRVGITVGKDCGNSVARHRLSRRIRGAAVALVGRLPVGTGVVIRALPSAAVGIDLSKEFNDFFHKAKI